MSFLPSHLRKLFHREKKREADRRVFSSDQELTTTLRRIAAQEGRPEDEIFDEAVSSVRDQLLDVNRRWNVLSLREQQVTALTCLGYTNEDIANLLGLGTETIKTHLRHIFRKFGVHNKWDLRNLLKYWDFAEWWDYHQP